MTLHPLRRAVVDGARALLATPFVHQARLPGVGIDCIGVPIVVGRALGLVAPDFDIRGYPRTPDGKTLVEQAARFTTRINRAEMQPGDMIAVRWGLDPQHVGILGDYVHGGLSLIHAYGEVDGGGSVIETHYGPSLQRRLVAVFRLPGVPA